MGDDMQTITEQAAKDARNVFDSYGSKALEAIDYMEQLIYASLRKSEPVEDVRAGVRIIPMHTESMYGVCIGGRWDGWVMVKHPDGYWVSHNKPDPIDPASTFNLIPEAKP